MKAYLLLLLILLSFLASKAQPDYFIKDTTTFIGNISIEPRSPKSSALSLQLTRNDSVLTFSPDEVSEYGVKNGDIYRSFTVTVEGVSKSYFFKRLFEGSVNLYYLKTQERGEEFFITRYDSLGLQQLPPEKEKFTSILEETLTGCDGISKNISNTSLTKAQLVRLFKEYQNCRGYPHPRARYGLYLGLASVKYSASGISSAFDVVDFSNTTRFMGGVFLDFPLGKGNFTFHPELNGRHIGAVFSDEEASSGYDMVIHHTSLSLPLLLRYNLYRPKVTSFFEGGLILSHSLQDKSILYQYQRLLGTRIDYSLYSSPHLLKNQYGYAMGAGIISKYSEKFSLYSAVRYNQYYTLGDWTQKLNFSEIQFHIGLMF
jgi:hypothetical protein